MICFFSADREQSVSLRKKLLSVDVFSYQKDFAEIEGYSDITGWYDYMFPERPRVAIVDGVSNPFCVDGICKNLKDSFPGIFCIVIYRRENMLFEKYRYFRRADYEFEENEAPKKIEKLLLELGYCQKTEGCGFLELGKDRKSCFYLGLPIQFTQSEYRILKFLCMNDGRLIGANYILHHCFADSYRMNESNVRIHISSINKKSKAVSGRNLIICQREKGYRLNEFM